MNRPGFAKTVLALLRASRNRARGRRKRQRELFQQRTGKKGTDWGALGTFLSFLFMGIVHIAAAVLLIAAVEGGRQATIAPQKEPASFLERQKEIREERPRRIHPEKRVQAARGESGVSRRSALLFAGLDSGALAGLLGAVVFGWWFLMLVLQGEGLELDLQRRRHPMWEWLLSHPAPPAAIFLAEMLSPLAANPVYTTAPIFIGCLHGFVHGPLIGLLAALFVGLPVAIAAACLGKALEMAILLRLSSRSKGAVFGLTSWLGYVLMVLFLFSISSMPQLTATAARWLAPLAVVPWPWIGFFLGKVPGSFSVPLALLNGLAFSAMITAGAVGICLWSLRQGLGSIPGPAPKKVTSGFQKSREPLYRKELLWFIRDRSAIVQTILIPLTLVGVQLFNWRNALHASTGSWNALCGSAIIAGTYFLWILGPKSLASEGTALWIPLTWPRGLENLLKAKAWLWSILATAIVALVLLAAVFRFPADTWKIFLVGCGWFFFARSMAEKSVTLVTVTTSSGEPEPGSRNRRWAASLGMLTFSIGIFSQQWHLAIVGIVYSWITAAAMWENFRARLPYLYDPWSEKLPPPPTLMHAMIAISLLVEGGAVLNGLIALVMGAQSPAYTWAFSYGISATLVSLGMIRFLHRREVSLGQVWHWSENRHLRLGFSLGLGALGGVLLGLVAKAYLAALLYFPVTAEILLKSQAAAAKIPGLQISQAVVAVIFAPLAEEYLFRGLLYRALDREWGGWRAILGSAVFFAIYHPALSWLPVGLLGVITAVLFKKTGRLAPAVLLHMVYNLIVVGWR